MIRRLSQTLLALAIMASALSASAAADSPAGGCRAPAKRQLEEASGEPVECPADSGGAVCFRRDEVFVIARFEPSGSPTSVTISTHCVGLHGLTGLKNQLVPEKSRGRFLRRVEKSRAYACQTVYADEYECLAMEHTQNNCQGCIPAAIKIVWRGGRPKAGAA